MSNSPTQVCASAAQTIRAYLSGELDGGKEDLEALVSRLEAAASQEEGKSYCVVQEGGSSIELYLHLWGTLEDAEQDRIDCTRDASYRTSPVVEVPASLTSHPSFCSAVDEILAAVSDLGYVHVEDEASEA